MSEQTEFPVLNTDRELWREPEDSNGTSQARLFVTEGGGIGICVGGNCLVMLIRDWFKLNEALDAHKTLLQEGSLREGNLMVANDRLRAALSGLVEALAANDECGLTEFADVLCAARAALK